MANRIGRGIEVYVSVSRPRVLSNEAGSLFDEYVDAVNALLEITKEMSRHQGFDIDCTASKEMESCYYMQVKYLGDQSWETSDQMAAMMGVEDEKNIEKLDPVPWIAPTARTEELQEIDEAVDKLLSSENEITQDIDSALAELLSDS